MPPPHHRRRLIVALAVAAALLATGGAVAANLALLTVGEDTGSAVGNLSPRFDLPPALGGAPTRDEGGRSHDGTTTAPGGSSQHAEDD